MNKSRTQFDRIFGFIRRDIQRILRLKVGGNCAVAVLVASGCETLAWYWHGRREGADVFAEMLPDAPIRCVAKSLYDAMRNGLVHSYDAKDLQFDGRRLQLAISWKEHKHLSVVNTGGTANLVLSVRDLSRALFRLFGECRATLETDAVARDRFTTRYRQGRIVHVYDRTEIQAWKRVLGEKGSSGTERS